MSRLTGTRSAAVAVGLVAVVVAGCSSSKTPAKTATTPPTSASASDTSSPVASSSLKGDPKMIALVSQSLAALAKAKSVHLKGSITESGDTLTLDLQFANSKGAVGSIGMGGGTFKFIAVDKNVYIQGDAAAFSSVGESLPPQALAAVVGKWINIGAGTSAAASAFGDFSSFSDISEFAKQFATASGTVSAAGNKTINGTQAIGILDTDADPSNSSVLYVAADGKHLPLEITSVPGGASAGSSSGQIDFLDYDAPVTVTAPVGAIDLSQIAGGSPSPTS